MVEDSFGRVKPRPGRNVHAGYSNDDDAWLLDAPSIPNDIRQLFDLFHLV